MSADSPRITLKMVAAEAGVHFSTVSLALNGHPSIPISTRERIQAVAERMGYRPDPLLSALVAYRMRKRRPTAEGVLGWVDMWPSGLGGRKLYPALWAGATRRAERLGWKLEEFRNATLGVAPERLSRMLRSRGIDGLLIAPMPGERASLELEWSAFSAITVGTTLCSPHLHRVLPHQVHNMQMLMRTLNDMGYTRPGLAFDHTLNERTLHYWSAAYLDAQACLPKCRRVVPFEISADGRERFLAWVGRWRPDVIIATRPAEIRVALEGAGLRIPADIGIVSPAFPTESWQTGDNAFGGLSGIDERFDIIGATAVDTLVGLIHRHERGIPEDAMHIMIEGRWRPGVSVSSRNA
jgi:LacI family transcriptional regulator